MKVAIYAIRDGGCWAIKISLDVRMDIIWWAKVAKDPRCRMVFLGEGFPLGWALKLEQVDWQVNGIDCWNVHQWARVVIEVLQEELMEEVKLKSHKKYIKERNMWVWKIRDGINVNISRSDKEGNNILSKNVEVGREENSILSRKRYDEVKQLNDLRKNDNGIETLWESVGKEQRRCCKVGDLRIPSEIHEVIREADILAASLQGRSLLAAEVDGLLSEAEPSIANAWFTAAQLAYLQGQLTLGAGVAPAPSGGAPWQRRRKVPRCQRCGSVALGRTACATCGRAACAYCEACLAMGRSRACTLLLRGAAQPAVRGTAGGCPTEAMGRWGLSAAQGVAAAAALRFLAQPPAGGGPIATSRDRIRGEGDVGGNRIVGNVRKFENFRGNRIFRNIGTVSRAGRVTIKRHASDSAEPDRFLLWAVTGAGKTEMIFPLLDSVLQAGGRVLVATPRRDVVLELAPRLAKAFPEVRVVTLYGGSEERWKPGTLTLATTHQLMRFYRAFDLVIIDEIDAFPYHNDPMLAYAAQHACKLGGKFVYLSATPPQKLQQEASSGRLAYARVPVRFHGQPLPVPSRIDMKSVAHYLQQQRIPSGLLHTLRRSIQRGAQLFVFVSRIRHIEPFVTLLRRYLPDIHIEGTSSVDPKRAEKVVDFRNTRIRMLITTTILERGVTVPRSDVFILDADSGLFDEASLIQMAGRAGRSKDDPAGHVVFASSQWTRSQKRAVRQIKGMNRIARRGGFLSNK